MNITGFDFEIDGNCIILKMRSDNPESVNWSNVEWYKWIKGWMGTMIRLTDCGIFKKKIKKEVK